MPETFICNPSTSLAASRIAFTTAGSAGSPPGNGFAIASDDKSAVNKTAFLSSETNGKIGSKLDK